MSFPLTGFTFDHPAGFRVQDMTVGFVTGLPTGGASPSLIVQTRPARQGATADTIAAEMLGELLQTIPGMAQGTKGEIAFDDGAKGAILSYTMASTKGPLRQYFVLRVDDGRVCTATLTAPEDVPDATAKALMKCLTSIRPAPREELA